MSYFKFRAVSKNGALSLKITHAGLKREQVVEINGKDRGVSIEPLRAVIEGIYGI